MRREIVSLLALLLILSLLCGCSESSPTTSGSPVPTESVTLKPSENKDNNESTGNANTKTNNNSVVEPAKDKDKEIAGIGDSVITDYFDFSVKKAETTKSITNALGITYEASEGKQLLFVVFSFKNTTSDIHNTGPAFVCSVDGNSINPFTAVGAIDECMPLVGAVGSGDTFNAYMIWEVPEGWENIKFSYLDAELGSASKTVAFSKSNTTER